MINVFKACVVALCAVIGSAGQALAQQCFVCSDAYFNTSVGSYAFGIVNEWGLTEDVGNTSVGYAAGGGGGTYNTANGYEALSSVTTGYQNVALGANALYSNTTGYDDAAFGWHALYFNMTGFANTAFGTEALYANVSGVENVALGKNALHNTTQSSGSTMAGYSACWSCTNGGENTGFGFKTLYMNSHGSSNVALGYEAGYNITGANNIDIGNQGVTGESGTIRIGTSQTAAYISGVSTTQLTGAAVYVNSSGQLGVLASSERYKSDIAPMPNESGKLGQLRPVTFQYKSDPKGVRQYGLVAEEVAKVYPELVFRDGDGRIDGVRYEELAPMLLSEVQQQQRQLATQQRKLARVDELERQEQQRLVEVERLTQQVAELRLENKSMQAALVKLLAKDERVAMR